MKLTKLADVKALLRRTPLMFTCHKDLVKRMHASFCAVIRLAL